MSGTSFTRNRKFSFKDLIITLMGFTRPGVQVELDRFFKAVSKSPESFETISKSAFTQSRSKLKPEAFIELAKSQLSYYDQHAPYKKTWKDSRVIAIDSSILHLPSSPELIEEFGLQKNQHQNIVSVSAKCSFAYDVENELVIDALIDHVNVCEKDLAERHLSSLDPARDILVFDRGYPAFWLMALLNKKGFRYCFRLSSAWNDAVALANSAEKDKEWTFVKTYSKKEKEKAIKNGITISQLEGLRMVCIPLAEGMSEVLVTNLTNPEEYSLDDLKTLYHKRWGIEEGYKIFKKASHIEHFTGKTMVSVKQDFYARIFMLNMASMIRSQGLGDQQQKSNGKYKTQINKTQALAKTKDFLIDLFYRGGIGRTLQQLLSILKKCYDIIRPNRSFIRSERHRRRHRGSNSKGI